ncbi:MAG: SDR family oxidoreductase [Betaproteobacteria bacterium]|nr:SDR family oxidoreductase [Betaproteobacteria bacterium]MDH5220079.1 SDR family oxidoreductase [Betaproteobacteria bacterium]MDH5351457.1 SDR family oxidoreductase [Betaproteobacteria bacterium]
MPGGVLMITGGGRGIGAATARLAARRGYAVCVNYLRDRAAAEAVVQDIRAGGGQAVAVRGDVAVENDVVNLFRECDRALGPLTALANNAGIVERQSRVEAMDAARLQRMFATNVVGAFLCAREAIRRMSTKHGGKGGAIVNISSGAARLGSPGEYVDYAASKGAIDTMTLGLARELAAEGIRVNCVRPGFVHTDIHASGGEPNRIERLRDSIPMKRGGDPEEVARAVLWLLSDEASYSTGAILDVTGGR